MQLGSWQEKVVDIISTQPDNVLKCTKKTKEVTEETDISNSILKMADEVSQLKYIEKKLKIIKRRIKVIYNEKEHEIKKEIMDMYAYIIW